jgi:hypothetical protein
MLLILPPPWPWFQIPFDEGSLNPPFLTPEAERFLLDDQVHVCVTRL